MSISLTCPTCGSTIKAPDSAAGKTGKCPKCAAEISVPAAGGGPPPLLPAVRMPIAERPPVAYPARQSDEREYADCPFCGEEILAKARKCKHCGETLDVALRAAEEAKRESRRRRGTSIKQVTHIDVINEREGFNHGIHIALDIMTCGFWFPIHLICWACH